MWFIAINILCTVSVWQVKKQCFQCHLYFNVTNQTTGLFYACTLNPSQDTLYWSTLGYQCGLCALVTTPQACASLTPPGCWGRTVARRPIGLWEIGWRAHSSPEEPIPSLMEKHRGSHLTWVFRNKEALIESNLERFLFVFILGRLK